MVTHEVWIDGAATPMVLDLEDDELFQHFKRWIQKDAAFTGGGWVGTVEGKPRVINFHKVACITMAPKNERGAMGFAT
jgi:hypothetical protein